MVELLVAITIIAILAAMLLGASSLAMDTARHSRTEALVARLHTLMSQHNDSFRHRRVELNDASQDVVDQLRENSPKVLAELRLLATREQLRMELPDRWSDVLLREVTAANLSSGGAAPSYVEVRPSMSSLYLGRLMRIKRNYLDSGGSIENLLANEGAECLYMIIMLAAGDGESAGLFKESDIGDTDGDGAPEFLDAWGQPIAFLRWAPGFDSDVQLSIPRLAAISAQDQQTQGGPSPGLTSNQAVQAAVAQDRDPFDLFRLDQFGDGDSPRGFRLVPLIYSPGPDQEHGMYAGAGWVNASNDPYAEITDPSLASNPAFLGQVLDRSTATDNIHNHLITGR